MIRFVQEFDFYCFKLALLRCQFSQKFLMILVVVYLKMLGKDLIVHCLLMDKLVLENLTQWLDTMQIKVKII